MTISKHAIQSDLVPWGGPPGAESKHPASWWVWWRNKADPSETGQRVFGTDEYGARCLFRIKRQSRKFVVMLGYAGHRPRADRYSRIVVESSGVLA